MNRFKRDVGLLVVAIVVGVFASACGSSQQRLSSDVSSSVKPDLATETVTMPLGYDSPSGLIADPTDQSVWFASGSQQDLRMFQWQRGESTLRSWTLPIGDSPGLRSTAMSALAVDPSGNVWLGVGLTLFKLNPASGQVAVLQVPSQPLNVTEDGYRPDGLRGIEAIQGLAVDEDRSLAVALDNAAAVAIVDNHTLQISSISLPDNKSATSVAFLPDGTLGIGLTDYKAHLPNTFAIAATAGSLQLVSVPDSSKIHAGTDNFTVGNEIPSIVTQSGSVHLVTVPERLAHPDANGFVTTMYPFGDGLIAAQTASGVEIIDPADPQSSPTAVPVEPGKCEAPIGPAPVTEGQRPPLQICSTGVRLMTVGSDGTVWYIAAGDPTHLVRFGGA